MTLSALLALLLVAPAAGEARISIDVKEAEVVDIVRLLVDVGGFQVVFDPGLSCRLTLKLNDARWPVALDLSLKACGLEYEETGNVLRIATRARLTEEAAERRRLDEERRLSAPTAVLRYRLSYARAAQMAPLVKRFLSARGEVYYDEGTNTLFIIDID
jgi:type IV pilus assembly protein PilQ